MHNYPESSGEAKAERERRLATVRQHHNAIASFAGGRLGKASGSGAPEETTQVREQIFAPAAPEYHYETDSEDGLLLSDESSRPRDFERVAVGRSGRVDYIRVSKKKSLGVR